MAKHQPATSVQGSEPTTPPDDKSSAEQAPARAAPRPAAPRLVRVTVVSNYGRHFPGARIDVTEREYAKFRKDLGEGRFECPVFISDADAETLKSQQRADERAKVKATEVSDERARSGGWADYQRRSLEAVRAERLKQQATQRAALTGEAAQPPSPEDQEAEFRKRVASTRTG